MYNLNANLINHFIIVVFPVEVGQLGVDLIFGLLVLERKVVRFDWKSSGIINTFLINLCSRCSPLERQCYPGSVGFIASLNLSVHKMILNTDY